MLGSGLPIKTLGSIFGSGDANCDRSLGERTSDGTDAESNVVVGRDCMSKEDQPVRLLVWDEGDETLVGDEADAADLRDAALALLSLRSRVELEP